MSPPNKTAADEDLSAIDAGDEVDQSVMDDAERDELAASKERGEDKTPAQIQAEMLAAMNADDDEAKPDDKPDGKVGPDGKPLVEVAKPDASANDATSVAAAAEKAAAEVKEAVDKEAAGLGLKGKAKERFHQLNDTIRTKDADIEAILGKAVDGDTRTVAERLKSTIETHRGFEDAIFSTGLTADDFQYAAGYKMAINSDDPVRWQQAEKFLLDELGAVRKRMGVEPAEGKTLLDDHPDLADKVERGAMDPEDAKEVAELRNRNKAALTARETTGQRTIEQQTLETANNECVELAQSLGADGAQWAAKWPELAIKVEQIRTTVPPQQWASRIALEYARIPYTPVATITEMVPRRRTPGVQPVRGGGGRVAGAGPTGMELDHAGETPFEAMQRGMREDFESHKRRGA